MSASFSQLFVICLSKASIFHVSKIQVRYFTTHYPKLNFDDSRILHYLSTNRFYEAGYLLDEMPKRSFQKGVVLWTSLLTKFARSGFVDEARALFEIMPEKNLVTYNAMLSGYTQCGRLTEASQFFEAMPEKNVVSWTSMLCGLADAGLIDEARRFFNEMPERNVVSWNSMMVGLIRNGCLDEAKMVFDLMPARNIISWNAMVGGYAEKCKMVEARRLFDEAPKRNVVTWTSMIAGYCRAGIVNEAYRLFQMMPEKNIISWTAMIGGFSWNGFYEEALLLFLEMTDRRNIRPNIETFVSLAYACAGMNFSQIGKQLHAQVIINGSEYEDYDRRLSKSLINMYSEFGIMDYAEYIFITSSNEYCIQVMNSLINGYIKIGHLEKAENLFATSPVRDKISWTSMLNGYLSAGEVSRACSLFETMPERDAIAWTVMVSGCVHNEYFEEAISLFSDMRAQGVQPLNSTYSVLIACAGAIANLDLGRQLHCLVLKNFGFDLIAQNSLIAMYAKCGVVEDAYCIFSNMNLQDVVSWNSMIMGFAHHGLANKALKVFEAMLETGTRPNSVTFLGVLSACSHAGLVHQGWEIFHAMTDTYATQPGLEHYVSMINLLGRAGQIEEAEEFVMRLPFKPNHVIWGTLLGVCGSDKKNARIAVHAANQLLQLDPFNAPAYVALRNIYSANGQHVEEQILRKEMELKGVKKAPGRSWIMDSA